MKCPFVIKICGTCKKILVASEINFSRKKDGKYGVSSRCKFCSSQLNKEYRKKNEEKFKKYEKERYQRDKEKRKEYNFKWRQNNKEYLQEYSKKYREEHKEELKEKSRQYYEEHKEYILSRCKEYYKDNTDIYFNNSQKRRHKLENQGRGITKEQWYEMMEFFDWRCAYSGEPLDRNNRSIDHIVPLSKNGLNEIWNCIPMTKALNAKKYNKEMIEWYSLQEFYSEENLMKIFEWIAYAFRKWGVIK